MAMPLSMPVGLHDRRRPCRNRALRTFSLPMSPLAYSRHLCTALAAAAALWIGPVLADGPPDVAAFDRLLRTHVRQGHVDYPALQKAPAFAGHVASLGATPAPAARDERLAFYINAYNALAIQGIVEGGSPSSFLGRQRYFKGREWPLAGASTTLHDLEHKLLRPMGEPRIHFAIVCASKSCPPLRSEAYVPARLDAQLDAQARAFVNDASHNRFDVATRTARLSEIFKWFDEDFRGAGSVQRYLARYVDDAEAAKLLAKDGFRVEWLPYDWSLNGTPPQR